MVCVCRLAVYCWRRVRPSMATARMPRSRRCAMFGAHLVGQVPAVQNFSVTGVFGTAPTGASRMSPRPAAGSAWRQPAVALRAFLAGQPCSISMIWAPLWTSCLRCFGHHFRVGTSDLHELDLAGVVRPAQRLGAAVKQPSHDHLETASPRPSSCRLAERTTVTPAVGATKRCVRKVEPAK